VSDTGRLVGHRYEIIREIAAGGMGTVFEAKHNLSKRTVALKVLHPQVARDDSARQRFLREVAAPARIGHDGICEVYDAGIDERDGSLFVAMEMLEGETLRERFDRPELSLDQKLDYMDELLEPLAVAHEKGIIHRDMKPENAFIARKRDGSEVVKLLDFGIVREVTETNVTQAGMGMGTPDYMSPEQATSAKDVTAASDIWSVGVMMYEAIAGQPPFVGKTPSAVVVDVITRPHTPLHTLVQGCPPPLSRLVDQCLSKEPEPRPQNAGELLKMLRAARSQVASVPRTMAVAAMTPPPGGFGGASPIPPTAHTPGPQPYGGASPQPFGGQAFGAQAFGGQAFGGQSPHPYGQATPHPTPHPTGGGYGTPAPSSPGFGGSSSGYGQPAYTPTPAPQGYGTLTPVQAPAKKGGSGVILMVIGMVVGLLILGAVGIGVWAATSSGSDSTRLRVNTNIEGGELFIDGTSQGIVANEQIFDVEPGTHRVELRLAGAAVASDEVSVAEGGFADAMLHRTDQVFTGELGPGDGQLPTGEYRDLYNFTWTPGSVVDITLEGSFDTYLIVRFPTGHQQDNDDGPGGTTNSALTVTATEPGNYAVTVTSYQSGTTGTYSLRVQPR
jgi:serine/threonine-protein kinase